MAAADPRARAGGVNIVATHGRPITQRTLVILAHLDSVRNSPGADDNVNGVAIILQAAEQILDLEGDRDVALVLVDLEEISLAGSAHLAKTATPGAVLNLESVGYYDPAPGSQRLTPGLGLVAPALVERIRARRSAADFVLVVHRRDSATIAQLWSAAAEEAVLPTVVHQDNRYTGCRVPPGAAGQPGGRQPRSLGSRPVLERWRPQRRGLRHRPAAQPELPPGRRHPRHPRLSSHGGHHHRHRRDGPGGWQTSDLTGDQGPDVL